jgi:alpha-galactosidase
MPSIVFLGAGSVVFTRDLLTDLLSTVELADARIVLYDIDADRLATARRVAGWIAEALGAKPTIVATDDRRTALAGADFVINSIQVGMHAATVRDFEIPAGYGLRQTIADTIGVGGIFRGLRTFPVLDAIARDMLAVCPDAWLLNYTNPMAMNVGYLHAVAPELKTVGLCHSVYWTVRGLCELIDVPYEEVDHRTAGMNHQAWLLSWQRDGADLYPLLDQRIAADDQLRRRVRVDMYRRLGFYPTETSEHSAEYVPWYLHHDGEVDRLRIPVGDYLRVSADNLAEYQHVRQAAALPADALERDGTEYAPQLVHSVVTGTPRRIVVNVPNDGLIDNLPGTVAVEVPATVDATGVHPEPAGSLPIACAAVNRSYASVVELTVAAGLTGDPRLVRQAALADPNTAATLTPDEIWLLCGELTAAHGDLLPPSLRARVSP